MSSGDFSHVYIVVHEYFGLQVETKKCQNGLLKWIIKHEFFHDYFLHMWPTSRVKFFEPNEY
jgi:hypothetical protein